MPSYDYRCLDCREEFIVERSMKDESQQACVKCGAENTSRIWRAFIIGGSSAKSESPQASSAPKAKRGGCGSCSSHGCGTC